MALHVIHLFLYLAPPDFVNLDICTVYCSLYCLFEDNFVEEIFDELSRVRFLKKARWLKFFTPFSKLVFQSVGIESTRIEAFKTANYLCTK